MKHIFILFAFTLLIGKSFSQEIKSNQLVLYGEYMLKVQTNVASFSFAFKGVGANLETAVSSAKNKVKLITEELIKVGLKEENFATSYFYSGENVGDKAFLSSERDYKAEIKVTVVIDSLDLLEKSIIKVSEKNPDFISEVTFTLKNQSKYSNEALEKATLNAKEKAESISKHLNITLGKIIYFEDVGMSQSGYGVFNTTNIRGGRTNEVLYIVDGLPKKKEGSSFYSPETIVTSRVKIVYQLN
jgi:uncharacterized protein YggE